MGDCNKPMISPINSSLDFNFIKAANWSSPINTALSIQAPFNSNNHPRHHPRARHRRSQQVNRLASHPKERVKKARRDRASQQPKRSVARMRRGGRKKLPPRTANSKAMRPSLVVKRIRASAQANFLLGSKRSRVECLRRPMKSGATCHREHVTCFDREFAKRCRRCISVGPRRTTAASPKSPSHERDLEIHSDARTHTLGDRGARGANTTNGANTTSSCTDGATTVFVATCWSRRREQTSQRRDHSRTHRGRQTRTRVSRINSKR